MQALVSNFWEAAASRGFESSLGSKTSEDGQKAQPAPSKEAVAPAAQQKGPAASGTPSKTMEVTKVPSAAPPPIHAAAMDFWRTAASTSADEDHKPRSAPAKITEQRAAPPPKAELAEFRPTQAPTASTNLAANRFWQAAAQDAYGDSGRRDSGGHEGMQASALDGHGESERQHSGGRTGHGAEADEPAPAQKEREAARGSGLAAAGKQQSARLAAVRLRQAAAVRNTSLAMVKAGNVPLSSSASIRSSALRAATDSSDGGSGRPGGTSANGRVRACILLRRGTSVHALLVTSGA